MKKNESGQTAFGAAIARYIEQFQPSNIRLFEDNIVGYLLPRWFTLLLKVKFIRNRIIKTYDKKTMGIYGGLVCRTKYIDESIRLMAGNNIRQMIILGSGLDTRPYRLEELKNTSIFEVDLSWVQEMKKQKLLKHFGTLPTNIQYVSIDFNQQTLDDVLKQHHFNFSEPAFIIWEGVTQYITEEAVLKTLEFIARLQKNSYLVFTYILKSVIDGKSDIDGANDMVNYLNRKNSPWIFGIETDKVGSFLKSYHLEALENVGSEYARKNYLGPLHRKLPVTEMERIVLAKVVK